MSVVFHELKVSAVTRETSECNSFELLVPAELEDAYRWLPGQHITIEIPWADFQVNRCYSIASCPELGEPPEICSKTRRTRASLQLAQRQFESR